MKVFINPGHALGGNPDPGAVNRRLRIRECDIAMTVGSLGAKCLEAMGHEVRLLQSHNLMGESAGPNVTEEANLWGADIFLSIHCNAANTLARGAETYCWEWGGEGARLAACVQRRVWETLAARDGDFPDRGVKVRKDLCVLRLTEMPSILSELAFLDNTRDARLLMRCGEELGRALAEGVEDFALGKNGTIAYTQ